MADRNELVKLAEAKWAKESGAAPEKKEEPFLGKRVAQGLGVSDKHVSDFLPGAYVEGPEAEKFLRAKLAKGGIADPTISGAVGAGLEYAAGSGLMKGAGMALEAGGPAIQKAMSAIGTAAKQFNIPTGLLSKAKDGLIGLIKEDPVAAIARPGETLVKGLMRATKGIVQAAPEVVETAAVESQPLSKSLSVLDKSGPFKFAKRK